MNAMTPITPASPRSVSHYDREIGERVRQVRKEQNVTLDELAKRLQLSYQQVHKYETGTNRIAAATLFCIAQILETPIDFFFPDDGLPAQEELSFRDRIMRELQAMGEKTRELTRELQTNGL